MTQYKQEVQRQKDLLKAEEWANGVESLHIHSLNSMWYDNRPEDTADGKMVTDKTFNSGLIERTLADGTIVYFGNKLQGDELIWKYKSIHA
jgi:hypothetical protein